MRNLPVSSLAAVALLFFLLRPEGKAANAGGEWVRVPDSWLLHRYVRASTTPAHTHKVALAFPAGANVRRTQPKITQSSGMKEVDMLAADFARESIEHSKTLRDLQRSKELYFQFSITPPALDINLRSEAARRAMPAGVETETGSGQAVYMQNRDGGDLGGKGMIAVSFPAGGGYATEALIYISTGSMGVDRHYVHTAALDWRTTHKSSQEQIMRSDIGVRRAMRWETLGE